MDIDLEALAEVARAANDGRTWFPHIVRAVEDDTVDESDAAHIAAASPHVVLALIERVRVAEARLARVEALADKWEAWDAYARHNLGESTEGPQYAKALRAALGDLA